MDPSAVIQPYVDRFLLGEKKECPEAMLDTPSRVGPFRLCLARRIGPFSDPGLARRCRGSHSRDRSQCERLVCAGAATPVGLPGRHGLQPIRRVRGRGQESARLVSAGVAMIFGGLLLIPCCAAAVCANDGDGSLPGRNGSRFRSRPTGLRLQETCQVGYVGYNATHGNDSCHRQLAHGPRRLCAFPGHSPSGPSPAPASCDKPSERRARNSHGNLRGVPMPSRDGWRGRRERARSARVAGGGPSEVPVGGKAAGSPREFALPDAIPPPTLPAKANTAQAR